MFFVSFLSIVTPDDEADDDDTTDDARYAVGTCDACDEDGNDEAWDEKDAWDENVCGGGVLLDDGPAIMSGDDALELGALDDAGDGTSPSCVLLHRSPTRFSMPSMFWV